MSDHIPHRLVLLICLSFLLPACQTSVERVTNRVELRLVESLGCRPARPVDQILIEALGNFPASGPGNVQVILPGAEPQAVEGFPFDTRVLRVEASSLSWTGYGVQLLDEMSSDRPLLLMPLDASCPVTDPDLRSQQSVSAALPDGSLLLFGGLSDGGASRQALRLNPGAQLATRLPTELSNRRVGAVAVVVDDQVAIIGGAPDERAGPAHDTWERFSDDRLVVPSGGLPLLQHPRLQPGATRLPGGGVLVAGGARRVAPEEDDVLQSVEILSLEDGTSRLIAELPFRRMGIKLLTLDDGTVMGVGGRLTPQDNPVAQLLVYDPFTEELSLVQPSASSCGTNLSMRREVGATTLIGGRAVVFETEPGERNPTHRLDLLRRIPPDIPELGPAAFALDCVELEGFPDLHGARGVGLADGRLLMTGADDQGAPRAFRIDVGRGTYEELPATRAATDLVALADGTIVELDEGGASLRRVRLPTQYDSPPATIFPEDLSLDAPGRWEPEGASLIARAPGARADLAGLRFANMELRVQTQGEVELLLLPELRVPVAVHIDSTHVSLGLCEVDRAPNAEIVIIREGQELRIDAGMSSGRCVLDDIGERIGIALRVANDASFEGLSIRRL